MKSKLISRIKFVIIFLFLCYSCKKISIVPDENVKTIFDSLPTNCILNIETYDGSKQLVHPDILYLNKTFILVATPYPFSRDIFENPCIFKSFNGLDFFEPKVGINPLVPKPLYDHNDDPDIIYNESDSLYNIYYLETMRLDSQNVISLQSKDLILWKKETFLHYNLKATDKFIVSPAILRIDSLNYMFYVNTSKKKFVVEYITFIDDKSANINKSMEVFLDLDITQHPWHIDIFKGKDMYYMLCQTYTNKFSDFNTSLFLLQSKDLNRWEFLAEIVNYSLKPFPDFMHVYRASGIVKDNTIYIYYSFRNLKSEWHIGITKYSLK